MDSMVPPLAFPVMALTSIHCSVIWLPWRNTLKVNRPRLSKKLLMANASTSNAVLENYPTMSAKNFLFGE